MAVRRVPLKGILQKLPRTVRDLAKDLDKQVDLELEGQMVQIDKSLIEALEAPVTHMVRNCVDHAIEPPAARRAAGKPESGTVRVRAQADEETFRLTISDDGRGLDADALRAKAVEKGQISEAQADAMTDEEAYQLIFGAGVSTAKTVTDVSGRGVGMDVVRSNIAEANGSIEIQSAKGEGTTFTITLPMTVTLLVVDGLLAAVGGETYIIPLTEVKESLKPERQDISTVSGAGEVVNVRGRLYPLLRLHRLFGTAARHTDPWETVVVLVEANGHSCALLVDDLLGQQSVVLKELSDYFGRLEILRGGAILGDGSVGLVLDVEALLEESLAERSA
jgi:two-component system chemotaxis sensor kinase CheA